MLPFNEPTKAPPPVKLDMPLVSNQNEPVMSAPAVTVPEILKMSDRGPGEKNAESFHQEKDARQCLEISTETVVALCSSTLVGRGITNRKTSIKVDKD